MVEGGTVVQETHKIENREVELPNMKTTSRLLILAAFLGVFSLGVLLASSHVADGDLWAKLALGAHVWRYGTVLHHDVFAFTPVLPEYIDHEWGAGAVFFGCLKLFGPASLMWLKTLLAFGTVMAALLIGRRAGASWAVLLLLAGPAAACIVLGYIPVIRSHAFTYFFFAVTLLCLERIIHPEDTPAADATLAATRSNRLWPSICILAVMLIWVNVHGGFVAGLGIIAIYTCVALVPKPNFKPTQEGKILLGVSMGCLVLSCINPYGIKFWSYLLPAVMAKRPMIEEWRPLPVFAIDIFLAFRLFFVTVVLLVAAGWKRVARKSWTGLLMLAVTALLAWRSRRHAPFFGIAGLAFTGPYLTGVLQAVGEWRDRLPGRTAGFLVRLNPQIALVALYGCTALYAAKAWLPHASFQVLAPVGHNPVREADILMLANAKGNLATPFHWGSYAAWRLYPNIKVSMDGRYETTFPESTFQLNARFFMKNGSDWDQMIKDYPVDYIMLDLTTDALRPEDLQSRGYTLVWKNENLSALMALDKYASRLRQVASQLPDSTIEPLDASIPAKWWPR
jgi:hypothetical protein